ncbi:hypothetical protein CCYA_CCYA17G4437 [Cyanidiococcus yangmingshanensis]|nr:hypothetical protein CCYA_CCYA17G4437 [Cyanidiococcus yangmingshanensis]
MECSGPPLLWVHHSGAPPEVVLGPRLRGSRALLVFYHTGFGAVFVVTESSIEAFHWEPVTGWTDKLLDRRLCVVFERPDRLELEHKQSGVVQLGGVAGARVLRATAACFLAHCNEVVVAHEDLSLRWYSCESGELGFETRSTRLVFDDTTSSAAPADEYVTRLLSLADGSIVAGHASGRVTCLSPGRGSTSRSLIRPDQVRHLIGSTGPMAVSALAYLGRVTSAPPLGSSDATVANAGSAEATQAVSEDTEDNLLLLVGYAAGFVLIKRIPAQDAAFHLNWVHTQEVVDVLFCHRFGAIFTASRTGEVALTDLASGRTLCRRTVPFRCAFARSQSESIVVVGGDTAVPLQISVQTAQPPADNNHITRPDVRDTAETSSRSTKWSLGLSHWARRFSTSMLTMRTACFANSSSDIVFISRSGQLASVSGFHFD